MNYKKLFRPSIDGHPVCIQIHSNNYRNELSHILSMVTELRKDFSVADEEIHIQKYGGQRVKGITFVEVFLPKETKMPTSYTEVTELEFIL